MVNKLTGLEGGLEVGQKINEIIDNKADVNADTTGNAGTATKLANARTISLTGDITGSITFDGSANKSITTTLGNTTKIDGQWVSKTETLSTATAVGTYTIDLFSYLPNDNYNYEIALSMLVARSGDGRSVVTIQTLDTYSNLISSGSASTPNSCHSIILLNDKYLKFSISSRSLTSMDMTAIGYRRIGTNS